MIPKELTIKNKANDWIFLSIDPDFIDEDHGFA
jgi:hypothetical protein